MFFAMDRSFLVQIVVNIPTSLRPADDGILKRSSHDSSENLDDPAKCLTLVLNIGLNTYSANVVRPAQAVLLEGTDGRHLAGHTFRPFSTFDKVSFYPSSLVLLLCVAIDVTSLMFGDRLRHKTESYYWTSQLPHLVPDLVEAIREQGLPSCRKP